MTRASWTGVLLLGLAVGWAACGSSASGGRSLPRGQEPSDAGLTEDGGMDAVPDAGMPNTDAGSDAGATGLDAGVCLDGAVDGLEDAGIASCDAFEISVPGRGRLVSLTLPESYYGYSNVIDRCLPGTSDGQGNLGLVLMDWHDNEDLGGYGYFLNSDGEVLTGPFGSDRLVGQDSDFLSLWWHNFHYWGVDLYDHSGSQMTKMVRQQQADFEPAYDGLDTVVVSGPVYDFPDHGDDPVGKEVSSWNLGRRWPLLWTQSVPMTAVANPVGVDTRGRTLVLQYDADGGTNAGRWIDACGIAQPWFPVDFPAVQVRSRPRVGGGFFLLLEQLDGGQQPLGEISSGGHDLAPLPDWLTMERMRELQLTWDRRGYLVQGADASGCSSTLEILGADGRSCAARTFAAPADNCGEETVLSVGRDGTVVQTFVRRRAPGANENRYPTCLWQFWPRLVRSP